MANHPHKERLQRCTQLMKQTGLDVLLLTKPANMFYLTGDGRLCAYAMITKDGKVAQGVPKTDVDDVEHLACFDDIIGFEDEVGMVHSINHHFANFGIASGIMGVEYTYLTQSMMAMVTHPHAKPANVEVKDCTPVLSALRIVKEPEEIERIKVSARVADIGMKAAVEAVKAGTTESQVAAAAEHAMRNAGAEDFWRSYVSSGPRTNIAHGLPSNRKLEEFDLVMIDIHPIVNGYSADICRTICVSQPTSEQQMAYDLYLEAQETAILAATGGVGVAALEHLLHNVIRGAGFGENIFGPPIHGVGIEFEEPPLPPGHAFFHGEKEPPPLEANMVIAIGNCGLYMGGYGVRVEDTLVVGADGPSVLTSFPRSLSL